MNPGTSKKGYGLFVPKSKATTVLKTKASSAFDRGEDDDDDDDDDAKKTATTTMFGNRKSEFEAKRKKQQEIEIEKAMAEDPNVFEYDSIYEDLDPLKKERDPKTRRQREGLDRKPKYITGLMAAAEKRKKDYERRTEKKIHAERDAEGDEFADKEQFVTTAYKKKMAELAALEEEERRQEAKEAAEDVTKQKDLTGFYRHMLDTRVEARGGVVVKEEAKDVKEEAKDGDVSASDDGKLSSDLKDVTPADESVPNRSADDKDADSVASVYAKTVIERRRHDSTSSEETEGNRAGRKRKSEDRSSSSDVGEDEKQKQRQRHDSSSEDEEDCRHSDAEDGEAVKGDKVKSKGGDLGSEDDRDDDVSDSSSDEDAEIATKPSVAVEQRSRVSLAVKYAKRTVGKDWEAARRRYLERKLKRIRTGYSVIAKNED